MTGTMIDGDRVKGVLTFTYADGRRREARFDLAEGEEAHVTDCGFHGDDKEKVVLQLVDAKAPGPPKGTKVKRAAARR